MLQPEKSVT